MGVELVGRWAAVRDGRALFSGGLRNVFSLADLKMERLLDTFDEWAAAERRATPRSARPSASRRLGCRASPRLQLDLRQRRDPHDRVGDRVPARLRLARRAGRSTRRASCATRAASSTARACTRSACPVLRRRKSTFIYGIEDDAREVIDHLSGYLGGDNF